MCVILHPSSSSHAVPAARRRRIGARSRSGTGRSSRQESVRSSPGPHRRVSERRQHVGAHQQQARTPLAQCLVSSGHLVRHRVPGAGVRRPDVASPRPCAALPCRGPEPPPGMPTFPVRPGKHAIARPACQPFSPLCMELPPRTIIAGRVPHSGAPARRCVPPAMPVIAAAHAGEMPARDRELLEAYRVFGDKRSIVALLHADHVHERERQRGIGSGPDDQHLV